MYFEKIKFPPSSRAISLKESDSLRTSLSASSIFFYHSFLTSNIPKNNRNIIPLFANIIAYPYAFVKNNTMFRKSNREIESFLRTMISLKNNVLILIANLLTMQEENILLSSKFYPQHLDKILAHGKSKEYCLCIPLMLVLILLLHPHLNGLLAHLIIKYLSLY